MWPHDEPVEPRRPDASAEDVRTLLGGLLPPRALVGSTLFVAAWPEDTLRSASWLLRRSPDAHVVHVTNAPVSYEALWLAGLPGERLFFLGAEEREASREFVPLTECLLALLKALRPGLLVVPPYAGGHPDHDAAAFVAHAAVALLVRGGRTPPTLLEMAGPGGAPGLIEATAHLSEPEWRLKQRMLACYAPRDGAPGAPVDRAETYRLAPAYDFTRTPPRGPREGEGPELEELRWRWRAREALETLKLAEPLAPAEPH